MRWGLKSFEFFEFYVMYPTATDLYGTAHMKVKFFRLQDIMACSC